MRYTNYLLKIDYRTIMYVVATLFFAVYIFSIFSTYSTYVGISERDNARKLQICDTPARCTPDFRIINEYSWNGRDARGYIFYLLNENSAPPPGIMRWPKLGETYLSPELIKIYPLGVTSLFGKVAGIIESNTMLSPNEPVFYARPAKIYNKNWGYPRQIQSQVETGNTCYFR